MSAASRKAMDPCLRFSASMAPYVDGELDAGHAVDMEAHVIACDVCAERIALLRAVRQSMKRTTARCPEALRARIQATIAEEQERAVIAHGPAPDATHSPTLIRLRHAVGLAAAAGVVFAMGVSRYFQTQTPIGELSLNALNAASTTETGIDSLLDTLIALHAHPFKPDTTDQEQLPQFDPLLGVRVMRPAFQPFGAHFQGARMHAVSDRGSLLQLQYSMPDGKIADGKHLTMYIFNPNVVSVHASRLQQRMVRHRPILVGRLRGYSVAALEQSGVGYAVASDFDQDESTKMVLAALQQ